MKNILPAVHTSLRGEVYRTPEKYDAPPAGEHPASDVKHPASDVKHPASDRKHSSSDISDYADILNLPHPVSQRHPRMPMENRAAQFAPFAALSGYEELLAEAEREASSDHTE